MRPRSTRISPVSGSTRVMAGCGWVARRVAGTSLGRRQTCQSVDVIVWASGHAENNKREGGYRHTRASKAEEKKNLRGFGDFRAKNSFWNHHWIWSVFLSVCSCCPSGRRSSPRHMADDGAHLIDPETGWLSTETTIAAIGLAFASGFSSGVSGFGASIGSFFKLVMLHLWRVVIVYQLLWALLGSAVDIPGAGDLRLSGAILTWISWTAGTRNLTKTHGVRNVQVNIVCGLLPGFVCSSDPRIIVFFDRRHAHPFFRHQTPRGNRSCFAQAHSRRSLLSIRRRPHFIAYLAPSTETAD